MGKEAKKFAKKKAREVKVKHKIAKRRLVLQNQQKEEKKQFFLQKLVSKLEKNHPSKDKLEQIKKNLEILKALEEEYIKEQASRENLHEQLEAEGFSSLEEKLKRMHEVAREYAEKVQETQPEHSIGSMTGSAVCNFKPNS